MAAAEMWFDPLCPWAWLTSRWLLEVEQVRDVQVRFHVMSLALLNEARAGRSEPRRQADGWGPVRVAIATDVSYGATAVRDLYTALGTLIHKEQAPVNRDLYALALTRSGLPHTLANAAETTCYDEAVRASHHSGVDPVGGEVGTPVIHLRGAAGELLAFFGPVVTPHPRKEAAGRLWDGVALAAGTDGFFELKRIRTRSPIFD